MRMLQTRHWLLLGGAVLSLGAAALWMSRGASPDGASGGTSAGGGWGMISATSDSGHESVAAQVKAMTPDQVRDRLFRQGSFAGTEPSGDWCVANGQLQACPELRKRFEYYILGLGEVTIEDIKALVADEARKAHGPQLAGEIMAIWDKYWQLRNYAWRNKFNQSDRSTWLAVFEEQKLVRRQILGPDWAKAFFEQDEKTFQQYYAQLESGLPPPPDPGEPVPQMAPGKDPAAVRAERVARYGEAAADRLEKADQEWADWERRLAGARSEWDRLRNDASLSDVQRKQQMQAYIAANFKADEHLRVQALLHL
jgi:lipase chaperone LimK